MKYNTLKNMEVIFEKNYKILPKDLKENQDKLRDLQFMEDVNSIQINIQVYETLVKSTFIFISFLKSQNLFSR